VKAAYFKEHGGSDKIVYGDYRDPAPAAGDVVVRVRACALNQVDMLLLDGRFPPPEGLPHVNGCEVAGIVETLGAGVTGLTAGQRVIVFPGFSCGTCEFCLIGERTVCLRYGYLGAHKDGGYAELVRVPAANCLPLADAIAFEAAAALPLAFLTSWHALIAKAGLRPGQTVLVQAAGSGVGSAAIQIARLCGARVMTTVGSDDKIDFARGLGAEHVVNYRTQDFVEEVHRVTSRGGVNVVIDMIGGDYVPRNLACLTEEGRHVSIAVQRGASAEIQIFDLMRRRLTLTGSTLRPRSVEFKTMVADEIARTVWPYVEGGRLKAVIDSVYPLDRVAEAFARMDSGEHVGKTVLEVAH